MTTLAISPAQVSLIQIIADVKLHFSTLIQYYMKMPPNVITDEKVHQVVCCFLIFMISSFLVLLMTPGSLLMMVSLPFIGMAPPPPMG